MLLDVKILCDDGAAEAVTMKLNCSCKCCCCLLLLLFLLCVCGVGSVKFFVLSPLSSPLNCLKSHTSHNN